MVYYSAPKEATITPKGQSTSNGLHGDKPLRCILFYHNFYLQTVQMQVHLANGVMGGEAGRGAPISTPSVIKGAKPGVEAGNMNIYKLTN
jgi:hypothetical protein